MISDYGTSKVLAVNEIELGMTVPTIESRASKISRDEGNIYMGLIESRWDLSLPSRRDILRAHSVIDINTACKHVVKDLITK